LKTDPVLTEEVSCLILLQKDPEAFSFKPAALLACGNQRQQPVDQLATHFDRTITGHLDFNVLTFASIEHPSD
jgi:hypothetical protein